MAFRLIFERDRGVALGFLNGRLAVGFAKHSRLSEGTVGCVGGRLGIIWIFCIGSAMEGLFGLIFIGHVLRIKIKNRFGWFEDN